MINKKYTHFTLEIECIYCFNHNCYIFNLVIICSFILVYVCVYVRGNEEGGLR